MGWLNNQKIQRLVGGGFLERFAVNFVARLQLAFLNSHKDKDLIRMMRRVRKERACLLTGNEEFMIYSLARAYARLPGAMAEVGVFPRRLREADLRGEGRQDAAPVRHLRRPARRHRRRRARPSRETVRHEHGAGARLPHGTSKRPFPQGVVSRLRRRARGADLLLRPRRRSTCTRARRPASNTSIRG